MYHPIRFRFFIPQQIYSYAMYFLYFNSKEKVNLENNEEKFGHPIFFPVKKKSKDIKKKLH